MKVGRNRWLLRLAIVLVAGLAVLLWLIGQRTRSLVIENRSGQAIDLLRVTIGDQTSTFHDVATGKDVTATGNAKGDDHYSVDGQLADGTRIRSSGLIGENNHFLLLPDGSMVKRRPSGNMPHSHSPTKDR
jgi:hypothetical protein